ncbi:MAG: XRE family transcriptional regulator [Candidatus Marinimicrobia bacterium]|nr:XRE family transcriptional regulator [Candidatus Neomarinimicrobiota bacterium]MCF7903997.1 XRE family transcriptional regulator [Candidatus Neomarinimicrobiota bacterium]
MGERIRRRRESLNIQAGDLASSVGVTASLISQIERAKAFPSILTLKKIADSLHITVGEIIGEDSDLNAHPVLKKREKKFVKKNKTGTRSYLLSHHDQSKLMDPFMLDFKPGADSSDIMTTNNPRQEYCFVLNGKFDVIIGAAKYTIKEGDSFYFTSNETHLFTNKSKDNSQLLWIVNQNN